MNRLRAKKKVKEETEEDRRESTEEGSKPQPLLKHSMTFRFGKKSAPEPVQKEELDLENALPKTDDFRTSLLMSGLSARFSMLREQDDPHSKIGKASDDSVLLPKRQSRLFDFGYTSSGLCDIAEVSSIHSSLRPPAPFGLDRSNSAYSLDNEDDGGSVMSRAKPAELNGNNLFGGRQKVYKLPNGGMSRKFSGDGEKGSMGGRVLYDDDVAMSAFQKLREKERRLEREKKDAERHSEESSTMDRRSSSPDLSGYNQNRETTCTTGSGPSLTRSSTAATSVASFRTPSTRSPTNPPFASMPSVTTNGASLDRSNTKTRRLYETGLDQQFPIMTRLDSISKKRSLEFHALPLSNTSPSANTFDLPGVQEEDVFNQPQKGTAYTVIRSASFDLDSEKPEVLTTSTISYEAPPLSPPMSDGDDISALPIDPRDRGKATAELTFSKPAQPYDDQKYVQRQLQMHTGRSTPSLRKHADKDKPTLQEPVCNTTQSDSAGIFQDPNLSSSAAAELIKRKKLPSTLRNRSSSGEARQADLLSPPFSSNAESNIYSEDEVQTSQYSSLKTLPLQVSSGNIAAPYHAEKPPDAEHPAIRQRSMEAYEINGARPDNAGTLPSKKDSSEYHSSPDQLSGLHGMVQQHLRSHSNTSSIYDSPLLGASADASYGYDRVIAREKGASRDATVPIEPVVSSSPLLHTLNVLESDGNSTPNVFEDELYRPGHRRDASTATQKERLEFHNALAARRRRVQENLRSFIDPESTISSPVVAHQIATGQFRSTDVARRPADVHPQPAWLPGMGHSGRDGRTASAGSGGFGDGSHQDPQAMRVLTRPNRSATDNRPLDPARPSHKRVVDNNYAVMQQRRDQSGSTELDHGMENTRDSHVNNNIGSRSAQRLPRNGSRVRASDQNQSIRDQHSQDRSRERAYGQRVRSPPIDNLHRIDRRPTESPELGHRSASRSTTRTTRSRSNSELSGPRSQSRTGRYKDDLARAMAEGTASSAQTTIDEVLESKTYDQPSINITSDTRAIEPTRIFNGENRVVGLGLYSAQMTSPTMNSPGFRSPRPSPATPSTANIQPTRSPGSSQGSVTMQITKGTLGAQIDMSAPQKRSVRKAEISEPTFVSSTARMTTVNLSEVAPLQGLNIAAPPLPTVNPRRRQTRIQTMFGLPDAGVPTSKTSHDALLEVVPPRAGKLRKSSSEGGNLRARAQAAFDSSPIPAMPTRTTPPINLQEGGMF